MKMKKIMIPVLAVIAALLIIATVLAQTNKNKVSDGSYHTHADGVTHYDSQTEPTYHVHEDGVTHWDEH